MTVGEVLAEVERDKEYYGGDGGLTASGGEPFAQQEGLLAMLRESRRLGIGTAVETTGNTPGEALWAAEPFVDHFLYDFKHVDDGVLRGVTGGDGKRIKENLAWLLGHCPQKVTVRIPVIPGFNAASGGAGAGGADAGGTDADGTGTTGTGAGKTGAGGAGTTGEGDGPVLVQMLRYLHSIGAKRVSLLPYHTLGKEKYQKLGREYTWGCGGVASAAASAADQLSPSDLVSDVAPLREEDLAWALQLAQGLGLTADVGG
jgi:pyruvate formate lyase activating enzyme